MSSSRRARRRLGVLDVSPGADAYDASGRGRAAERLDAIAGAVGDDLVGLALEDEHQATAGGLTRDDDRRLASVLRRVHFEESAGGDGALRVVEHRRAEVGRPVRRQEERGGDRGAERQAARMRAGMRPAGSSRRRRRRRPPSRCRSPSRARAPLPRRVQRLEHAPSAAAFSPSDAAAAFSLLEPLRRRADVVAIDVRHAVAVQLDRRVERRLERRGRGVRARLHRLGQLLEPLPQPAEQHARGVEERLVERLDVGRLAQPLLQREKVAARRAVVQQPRRVDPRELRHRRRAWLYRHTGIHRRRHRARRAARTRSTEATRPCDESSAARWRRSRGRPWRARKIGGGACSRVASTPLATRVAHSFRTPHNSLTVGIPQRPLTAGEGRPEVLRRAADHSAPCAYRPKRRPRRAPGRGACPPHTRGALARARRGGTARGAGRARRIRGASRSASAAT